MRRCISFGNNSLFYFFTILFATFIFNASSELSGEDFEYETVFLTENEINYRSNSEISINFQTTQFKENYSLHLKRASNIFHSDFQLIVLGNNEENHTTYKRINVSFPSVYLDDKHHSVLHIQRENNFLQAEGILTPDLSIIPKWKLIRGYNSSNEHVIVKSPRKQSKNDNLNLIPNFVVDSNDYLTSIPTTITPELLVIVDYKNSKELNFNAHAIVKYLAIFWNAVNARYALIQNPQVQLKIISGVVIEDIKFQPYFEKSRVGKGGKMIADIDALIYLAQYMYENDNIFPNYDIAMVMTKEDLAIDEGNGDYGNDVAGLAFTGGACNQDMNYKETLSVGLGEDHAPFFSGVLTHAHEVAHLLGAGHDGEPATANLVGSPSAESCPFSGGYLMSYDHGTANKFQWSKCSIQQMKWFFGTKQAKCLRENQSEHYISLNTTLPGELVSLNDQCKFLGSVGQADFYQDKNEICTQLYCMNKPNEIISSGSALEGTPCGYSRNKWCREGVCVSKD